MPDLIKNPNASRPGTTSPKKKKKDEVAERLTKTDTGSGTKVKTTSLPTTGQKKKDTVAQNLRPTDTKTGDSTYAQRQKKNEEQRQASQEAKEKLRSGTLGSAGAAELREQSKTSKKIADQFRWSGNDSSYWNYVAGEKARQASAAESRGIQLANQKELIEQEQRKDRLRTWDLEAAKKERAEKLATAEKAQLGMQELIHQMNQAATKGDQAAVLRLKGQLKTLQDQIDDSRRFDEDYKLAESLQYLEKGRSFLEDMQKNDSATFGLVDTIARSKVFGIENVSGNLAALTVGQKSSGDVLNETISKETVDEAYKKLRAAGYQPKDIEQWIDWQVRLLNEEQARDIIAKGQQFAHENPFEATLGGRILNPFAGAGMLEATADTLTGRPIDFNSSAMLPGLLNQSMTEQVSQDIMEKHPGASGQLLNFLYTSGVSMADSTVNATLAGVGLPQQAGLLLMSGSAGVSALKEAHERGLTDSQALSVGFVAAAAEYITERIELNSLMDILNGKGDPLTAGQRLRKILTNRLKQAHEEGREEVMSDLINFTVDLMAFNGSQFNPKVKQYEAAGYSNYDAVRMALIDQAKDTAMSYAGGFLSGWVMGGAAGYINTASNAKVTNDYYTGLAAGKGTVAYDAAQNLRRVIDEIDTKSEDEITMDDHAAYQAAVNGLTDALDALPDADLKEARKEGKALKKADKEAARTKIGELLGIRQALEQFRHSTDVELDNKKYHQNGVVQNAAALVATGKQKNISSAVGTIMKSPEAIEALGLSFEKKTSNTQKRTQILTALKELVAQAQEAQPTETPVEVNNSTEEAPTTETPAAVSEEAVPEETPMSETLPSYEEYENGVLENNPEATPEQIKQWYADLSQAYEDVQQEQQAKQTAEELAKQVEQDIAERKGKRVYIKEAKKAVDYDTFRRWSLGYAKADGESYTEAEIRTAFDAGVAATQAETAKYEVKRRKGVTEATERIDKAFKKNQLGIGARISFDATDFGGTSATEHAFYDHKTKSVVLNGDILDTEAEILYYLGHEVVHPAARVDSGFADAIIETFQQLEEAGKLRGELSRLMRNFDAELKTLQKAYQDHENELAKRDKREAQTIDESYAREEFAANLMRYAFSHTKLFKDIAGRRPGLVARMKQSVGRVMSAVAGDEELDTMLQGIADRLDEALKKVPNANLLEYNPETITDEALTEQNIESLNEQNDGRLFSLSTMRQDLDGYMQDLRDAGLVGEGKPMSDQDLTDLFNGINKVMDYVEDHIDEIERNENYRNMTAGNRPFNPYKNNADPHYKLALDFSTLCRKRLLTQAITERLQGALKRALTPVEQVKIRDMIKKLQAEGKKIDVACALCYVEAARLKSPKVINDFLNNRAKTVWLYHSLKDSTFKLDVYQKRSGDWKEQHGLPRNATKAEMKAAGVSVKDYNKFLVSIRDNYQSWLQQNNPERYAQLARSVAAAEAMDASEFLNAQSLARMRNNPDLVDIYDAFITKIREATRSKAQETDVPYVRGDVNQVGQSLIDQMNEESGFRHQSWSDFQAMHLLDTVAAIMELATRGAKMHTYTKVADMVRFLGETGMMMNMSLIPAGETGFDENGNLLFDPVEGMDYQTMLDLRRKFHSTAGNIAIGISDAQILAMLNSPEIDYIIPYHTSGLNADMRRRMGIRAWKDYTQSQNEKGDDWDKKAPKLREWFNESEALLAPDGVAYMVEASRKYLQLCHERGLVPKFPQFLQKNDDGSYSLRDDAQNYWKLLIDRKMVDQYTGGIIQQKAVLPKFKVNTMMDILQNEVNSEAARDAREAEDYIVNKVLTEGMGVVTKEELERARIIRDATARVAVENAAEEMGFGRRSSIAYNNAASDATRSQYARAQEMIIDFAMENHGKPLTDEQWAEIREKTGWWRSPHDHQWRYWISDDEAELNPAVDNDRAEGHTEFMLYDLLRHDRLYQDYPELEDVVVVFDLPEGTTAGKLTGGDTIHLQADAKLDAQTLSNLLHEVQHAIQVIEIGHYNEIQSGSNTDAGYKQAFVAAYRDLTDNGNDTSMLEGLSYKQAVHKIEKHIVKMVRSEPGLTERERRQYLGNNDGSEFDLTEEDLNAMAADWVKQRRSMPPEQILRDLAFEYYEGALGEIDARMTGEVAFANRFLEQREGRPRNDREFANSRIDDRINYGEETRRGSYDEVRQDLADFRSISRELGWDGNPAHLYAANYQLAESQGSRSYSIAKAPGEDTTLHIPDGTANGKVVSFTDLILDGKKLGETRGLNVHLPVGRWIGIDKNGQVVGRVILGEPKRITNKSPEYKDSYIEGTSYDLADGEEKLYYPIVEVVDMRDNPKPVLRSSAQYGVYQTRNTNTGGRQFSIDLGYHAGDLGKSRADGYWGMGGRSTGHFGTGTYFVGDKASLVNTGYDRRPLETADFSQYNLFRPRSTQQGYDLHDALKGINNYIEGLPVARLTSKEYVALKRSIEDAVYDATWEGDVSKREQILDFIRQYLGDYYVSKLYEKAQKLYDEIHFEDTPEVRKARREEAVQDRKRFEDWHKDEKISWAQTVDEEVEEWAKRGQERASEYDEDARKMSVEDIIFAYSYDLEETVERAIASIDNLRSWYNLAPRKLRNALGLLFTEAEIQDALQKTYDTVQTYTDRNAFYDSASTVFMKALGYDGIDVRGIKGLDNTSYGSVIYDLVGNDLARKQEIGTARYSLQQDDELLQAFIDAYENKQGDGQLKKDFPTIEQQLREARRELARAEKKAESEQAKRLVAEKVTKETREAWQKYARKTVTKQIEQYEAKLETARQAKRDAVKAEREKAKAKLEETKLAERMNAGKKAAKRLGVKDDAYGKLKENVKERAILRRNSGLSALRNKGLAEQKRNVIETQQGPIDTLRKSPQERTFREKVADAAEKLRVTGRDLYAKFVSQSAAIERVTRRQRGPLGASTLATIVGGVNSTVGHVFNKALVDKGGDVIGASFTDTFICTENDAGKVMDEPRQALLQDYLLHRHNVDRMSFVARAEERLERFEQQQPWLAEMDNKEFARLVALTDKEAEKLGKEEARRLAREYSRLLQELAEATDKEVFADLEGNPITAETSRERVAQLEREAPWLIEKAAGIDEWWDKFMRAWVVGTSITEAQYDHMREIYPHYVPTYRKDKGGFGFSFSSSNGAAPGQFTKRATGSVKEIVNVEDSFANLVQKGIKQARINELYQNLVDTAMLDHDGTFADMMFFDWFQYGRDIQEAARIDIGDHIEERDTAGLTKDGDGYRVSAWYDGELIHTYVSEELFKSLSLTVGHASDRLDKLARIGSALTSPMKTAITGINPNFALRNVARDVPTAIVNSVSGLAFPKYWARAWREIEFDPPVMKRLGLRHHGSANWQHYQALGGGDALYYNNEGGYGKATNMTKSTKGSIQRGWNTVKSGVGWFNEITESVTRFAEYLATIDRLGDTYEGRLQARKNAAEVTVDFSRHGEYGKAINAWIPYWNPAIQGIDKVIRSVVETKEGEAKLAHAMKTIGKAAVTTALLDAILHAVLTALDKEKDWEKLDDRTKDTYYCIPYADNKYIKIPKNREWGAILGTPLVRLWEWGFNGRSNPFENYFETSFWPNFMPGMPLMMEDGKLRSDIIGISQAMDLANNTDFAGRTIIPYAYQQGSKAGQYNAETSQFTKWLSDALGNKLSPMQLDYIVKDYFGDFGKMFTQATSIGLWSGDVPPEEVADYALSIIVNPWKADNRFSNQYMSKYYEIRDDLEKKVNDLKNHTEGDSYKDTIEYKTYQALTKGLGKDISDLNKSIRNETDEEVKGRVKGQMVELAQQAIEFYNDSMAGKIKDPELVVAYRDLPQAVSEALIKLDDLTKDYSIKPSENNTDTAVDAHGLKIGSTVVTQYKLDDEAKKVRSDLRAQYYDEYMLKAVNSSAFKSASKEKQAEMLEDAKSDAYKEAADDFSEWLTKNRKPELKDERELPKAYKALSSSTRTELTNLYGKPGTEKYTFTPADNTTKSYSDPDSKQGTKTTREYKLDDEALAYYDKLRQDYYESYVSKAMRSSAYKKASDVRKAEILAEARKQAYDDAREQLMKWLKKNRKSTPKD